MKATERTFFLDGRARVDRYSHRKWCLRGPSSRSGDGLIEAKFGRKPGIPALRVTGKGSGCIRCMIVSVCSAFRLFFNPLPAPAGRTDVRPRMYVSPASVQAAGGSFFSWGPRP